MALQLYRDHLVDVAALGIGAKLDASAAEAVVGRVQTGPLHDQQAEGADQRFGGADVGGEVVGRVEWTQGRIGARDQHHLRREGGLEA